MKAQQQLKYLVIGDPISHSLSPEMQNAAFNHYGLGKSYGKMRVTKEEFQDFIDFAKLHLNGFNITVPHKKLIIPALDEITQAAAMAESVNTVTIRDGKLYGDSTDGYGLATAIREVFGIEVPGNSFFFIGCGGAVQATAFYFAAAGARALYFANRSLSKVEELTGRLKEAFPAGKFVCCGLGDLDKIQEFVASSQVAVQGTSLGLKDTDAMPFPGELLHNICFYETIYHETPLLRLARAAGLKTAGGATMLLHQGAKSFEIWTGKPAPVEEMRTALMRAMDIRKGHK